MGNKSNSPIENKEKLLTALEKSLGVVSSACKKVGLSRKTFYAYYNEDPEFKKAVDDLQDVALDFVESKMFQQINSGDSGLIKYYMSTKGRRRGYVEKSNLDITTGGEPFSLKDVLGFKD